MFFVGDVHGAWGDLMDRVDAVNHEDVFLLGDIGIGFYKEDEFRASLGKMPRMYFYPKTFPKNVKFIRGNHDNPAACKSHPNCLGDYGVIETGKHKIGYVAGGFSIDRAWRKENIDWWRDEEISTENLYKALDLFEKEKPDLMFSHEAPESLVKIMFNGQDHFPSRTNQFLDSVLVNVKSINEWFCGHYHFTFDKFHCGVEFHVLNCLEFRHYE